MSVSLHLFKRSFCLWLFVTMALSFELRSFHPSLPERDLYLQANINTSEGKKTRQGRGLNSNLKLSLGKGKCKWWKQMIYQGEWLPVELLVPLQMTGVFVFGPAAPSCSPVVWKHLESSCQEWVREKCPSLDIDPYSQRSTDLRISCGRRMKTGRQITHR